MRRRTTLVLGTTLALITALVVVVVVTRPSAAADDAPADGVGRLVDRVLPLVGGGQADDAIALMDGLKDRPDQKDATRAALLSVRDVPQLGSYRGYDTAAVVRYSGHLQTVDVLANYDLQPILYRLTCYQPSDGASWQVLNLEVQPDLRLAMATLRDDTAGLSTNRGGRSAR